MSTDSPQPQLQPQAAQLQNDPLYEFSIYPFSTDPVFQEGLQNIISSTRSESPDELEKIISQAKVFYFARTTGHKVTWENYLEWQKSHPSAIPDNSMTSPIAGSGPGTTSSRLEEQAQLTFQQITELINAGQTHLIPNNKVIPETLHSGAPSKSTQAARKKPWERTERDDAGSSADERITPQSAAGPERDAFTG